MSRHYERAIKRLQSTQATVGQPSERSAPRTSAEIESFVKGFGLSTTATKLIVDEWVTDNQRAHDSGWDSHADSVWYDEN